MAKITSYLRSTGGGLLIRISNNEKPWWLGGYHRVTQYCRTQVSMGYQAGRKPFGTPPTVTLDLPLFWLKHSLPLPHNSLIYRASCQKTSKQNIPKMKVFSIQNHHSWICSNSIPKKNLGFPESSGSPIATWHGDDLRSPLRDWGFACATLRLDDHIAPCRTSAGCERWCSKVVRCHQQILNQFPDTPCIEYLPTSGFTYTSGSF